MIRIGAVTPTPCCPGAARGRCKVGCGGGVVNNLRVDNWRVHLVRQGDTYGATGGLTHDKADPLVEFYDTSGDPEKFPGGQFVARYYADTLKYVKGGLNLAAGIAVWSLSAKQMAAVNAFLEREVAAPVHLHTPAGRTYCGAPPPEDRENGWTALRSEATCHLCVMTLREKP